jgi:succinate dehydrogenase / fumarate reductase membrane anchor subunit
MAPRLSGPTLTAVLMALYTVVLLVRFLTVGGLVGYEQWAICSPVDEVSDPGPFVALGWHAWIGVRDIWMDYVKPVGLRLALQVVTIVWLVGCIGWGIQVLWRL